MRFIHLDTVGSTQDEARGLYKSGDRGPVWIRADRQTSGRGRRSRKWVSESGNFSATYLVPHAAEPAQSALYGFCASLAIRDTLMAYSPVQTVTLKWPNDVLIGGAKVSGLLIEREAEALLLGIGINLTSHPNDLPYPATHLVREMSPQSLAGPEPLFTGAASLLALLAKNVAQRFQQFEEDGFDPIRSDWSEVAQHIGKTVTINMQTGTFTELANDGALCLRLPDGTKTCVHAGDVAFG